MVLRTVVHHHRRLFLQLGAMSIACFLFIALLVHANLFSDIDYSSMVGLQDSISRSADGPLSWLTLLGSSELTVVILAVVAAGWWWKKRKIPWSLCLLGVIFLVEILGKVAITHVHPPAQMNRYTLQFSFPSSSYAPSDNSFPSGHMARSMFVATVMSFLLLRLRLSSQKKIAGLMIVGLYVLIVFVSRIYLGAHWVSDVLGGCFLGLGVALFSLAYWELDQHVGDHQHRGETHGNPRYER